MNYFKMNKLMHKFPPHTVLKQHSGNKFCVLINTCNIVHYTTTVKYIQLNHKHNKSNIITQCKRLLTTDNTQSQQHSNQFSHTSDQFKRRIGIVLFLSCAAYTAYLGTWQIRRKQQKIDAINDRTNKLYNNELNYDELIQSINNKTNNQISSDLYKQYEYNSIVTDGIFDYDNQYYIGPRTPPSSTNDPLTGKPSTLIEPNSIGYYIVTPFKTIHGNIILVNRGWVTKKLLDSNSVPTEQRYSDSNGVVHVNGVLRTSESKPKYLSNNTNKSNNNELIYIDLPYIASQYTNNAATNTLHIEMNNEHKSLSRSDIYPIRKQKSDLLYFTTTPLIHTVYAGTWFTLSGVLTAMTYIRFFKR